MVSSPPAPLRGCVTDGVATSYRGLLRTPPKLSTIQTACRVIIVVHAPALRLVFGIVVCTLLVRKKCNKKLVKFRSLVDSPPEESRRLSCKESDLSTVLSVGVAAAAVNIYRMSPGT